MFIHFFSSGMGKLNSNVGIYHGINLDDLLSRRFLGLRNHMVCLFVSINKIINSGLYCHPSANCIAVWLFSTRVYASALILSSGQTSGSSLLHPPLLEEAKKQHVFPRSLPYQNLKASIDMDQLGEKQSFFITEPYEMRANHRGDYDGLYNRSRTSAYCPNLFSWAHWINCTF